MNKTIDTMSIETLCVNLKQLGFNVHIIDTPNWRYSSLFPLLKKEVTVFIFDTLRTGCGEFGEQNPSEIIKDKWQDSFGILQCRIKEESGSVSVLGTVMPKHVVKNKQTVLSFLKSAQRCSVCRNIEQHVKIHNETGEAICVKCFEYYDEQFKLYEL